MRSSCREDGRRNTLGYFRGAREFFPQGTFKEIELVVALDPVWHSSDGISQVVMAIGAAERKLNSLKDRKDYLVRSIADDQNWWRPSPEMKQLYRQELKTLRQEAVKFQRELDELQAIIG